MGGPKGYKFKSSNKNGRQRVTITNKNLRQFAPLKIARVMEDQNTLQQVNINDAQTAGSSQNTNTSNGEVQTLKSTLQINIPTQNQYAVLEATESMDTQYDPIDSRAPKTKESKKPKPPAIILHNKIEKPTSFIKTTDVHIKKGYFIKNSKNNTNIFINDYEEYENYKEILEKEDISFHSYTPKNEKPHSFVLKGINSSPDEMQTITEEIKSDLNEKHNIIAKNVFQLKTKGRSLFVVQTNNTIHLKYLTNNVRYVYHTKITWERYRKQDPWVQCRRCQRLGHSTSNCRAEPKCVKCGLNHWSKECTNVIKENEETHINIKCANCDGKHLAFSKECPVLQKRRELIQNTQRTRDERLKVNKMLPRNKTNYVMAPPPLTNAWTQRTITNERSNAAHTPITTTTEASNTQTNFTDLVSEFNMLGQLLDLNKMLILVRELNNLLKTCKDDLEKFVTLNNFCIKNFKANPQTASLAFP